MATDATGTPTSPDGLAKINPSVDAPSGVGQNSLADSIQTALTNNYVRKPSGLVSGEVPVWNGTGWDRSSVTNIGPTSLGSGTPDSTKYLRGDGSWATIATSISVGTALPGSPSNGDRFILTDSLTAPTYQWLLQYDTSISGSYKWRFLGGSPQWSRIATQESTTSTSYTNLTTTGPSVTIAQAGVYNLTWGSTQWCGHSGGSANMSVALGATAASANWTVSNNSTSPASLMNFYQFTGAASDVLTAKYSTDSASCASTFQQRWLNVTPVLLG